MNELVWKLANSYIVHSKRNKEILLKKTKKPVYVVPHGIIELKKSKFSKIELRQKYGFSSKDKILLFFGGIRKHKGLDVLLKSLREIKDENVKLIIAGKPWEKFEPYEKLIKDFDIGNRIKLFLEFVPNKTSAELFAVCDLVVLPYKEFEATSGVGALALNFAKPMIVTDVGGLPEIAEDKNVVAKAGDSKDLEKKIRYALDNLKKLAKDSRENAKEFSWVEISKKTLEVYER